jgi:hypothetical protein
MLTEIRNPAMDSIALRDQMAARKAFDAASLMRL